MKSKITIVSGYWIIKNKHSHGKYENWFKNTLQINCPYIFFGDDQSLEIIKKIRNENYPTIYIKLELTEFYTARFYNDFCVDSYHCPSKELNMIWNEKIFLVQKAKELNPFDSEFFIWADAGICTFRDVPPSDELLETSAFIDILPKDKLIFTSSETEFFSIYIGIYNYHFVSGTSFMIHKDFIDRYTKYYKKILEKYLIKKDNLYTDQVIHTIIYNAKKQYFHKIGHGYGELFNILYRCIYKDDFERILSGISPIKRCNSFDQIEGDDIY
jgi:hypothetical protein